jgi:CII-binding regulator of phage lambda lysogenization HflD
VRQGKVDQAKHSLKRLYGNTEDDLDMHLKVIEETLEFEARLHASSKWSDMFKLVITVLVAPRRRSC